MPKNSQILYSGGTEPYKVWLNFLRIFGVNER